MGVTKGSYKSGLGSILLPHPDPIVTRSQIKEGKNTMLQQLHPEFLGYAAMEKRLSQ